MPKKYDKEYKRHIQSTKQWIRITKDRMALLPDVEKMSQLNYEQWVEIFKTNFVPKSIIPSPPDPPNNNE